MSNTHSQSSTSTVRRTPLAGIIAYAHRVWVFWRWVVLQFYNDRCLSRASALTFTSLLALVPLMVVMFGVFRLLPGFSQFVSGVQNFIFANFVPSSGTVVQQYVANFAGHAGHLPLVGIVFLVVTALLMMISLENTLNEMWQIRYQRQISASIVLYWAMLTLGPLLLALSLVASSYLGSVQWLHGMPWFSQHYFLWALPLVAELAGFCFLYWVVPHATVRFHHAFLGACAATVLFEVAKYGFGYYILYFPTYQLIYGALATIPLFLLWLYCSWVIFLLGAEIVNGLRLHQARRSIRKMPLLVLAYRVLGHLWQAQEQHAIRSLPELLTLEAHCSVPAMKQVLEALVDRGFICLAGRERYVLSVDLHTLTLRQLYVSLEWFLPEHVNVGDDDHWRRQLNQQLAEFAPFNQTHLEVALVELYQRS